MRSLAATRRHRRTASAAGSARPAPSAAPLATSPAGEASAAALSAAAPLPCCCQYKPFAVGLHDAGTMLRFQRLPRLFALCCTQAVTPLASRADQMLMSLELQVRNGPH